MRLCILFIAISLLTSTLSAQLKWPITNSENTPAEYLLLLQTNAAISRNDTLNEQLLDLVEAGLVDSLLPRKKPHHKLFLVGWGAHVFFGYNWRKLYPRKGKLVGTVIRQSKSAKEEFTEFDVNQDLVFHLPKYLQRGLEGIEQQRRIHRQDYRPSHHRHYKAYPFIRDSTGIRNLHDFRIHTELTPPRAFRHSLNNLFYPVIRPMDMARHPNFRDNNPSIGVYGAYCLDCNHSCHAELHPYEWLWWLRLTDSNTTNKTWFVGLMKEGSNRFTTWVKGPRVGFIEVPFILDVTKPRATVSVTHLLMNDFIADSLRARGDTLLPVIELDKPTQELVLESGEVSYSLQIQFEPPLFTKGLRFSLTQLNYDAERQLISGKLKIGVAVKDVYTARIQFYQPDF